MLCRGSLLVLPMHCTFRQRSVAQDRSSCGILWGVCFCGLTASEPVLDEREPSAENGRRHAYRNALHIAGKGFALPCQQQRVFDHYIPGPFHRSTAVTRNCSAVPSRLANAAFVRKSSTSSGVRSRPLSLKKCRQALQMNVMWSSGFAECRKQDPRACET